MVKSGLKLAALPVRAVAVALPAPLDQRLDQLWEMANREALSTSRREIVAALIYASPTTSDGVRALIADYREATPADGRIGPGRLAGPSSPKRPGRRKLIVRQR